MDKNFEDLQKDYIDILYDLYIKLGPNYKQKLQELVNISIEETDNSVIPNCVLDMLMIDALQKGQIEIWDKITRGLSDVFGNSKDFQPIFTKRFIELSKIDKDKIKKPKKL